MACNLVGAKYQNQCWSIINWTHRNKLQWNLNRKLYIFIHENAFQNVVCKMAVILSRPQCAKYSPCYVADPTKDSTKNCRWNCSIDCLNLAISLCVFPTHLHIIDLSLVLCICYSLIERHAIRISFRKRERCGAIFFEALMAWHSRQYIWFMCRLTRAIWRHS